MRQSVPAVIASSWACTRAGRAHGQGLDLVELDPLAHPPVCKILDFRNFKYEVAKARVHAQYKHVELEIRDNQIKGSRRPQATAPRRRHRRGPRRGGTWLDQFRRALQSPREALEGVRRHGAFTCSPSATSRALSAVYHPHLPFPCSDTIWH